jgi:hypothetical protein
MIEILHQFPQLIEPCSSNQLRTFHLAEGPGGFIEAVATSRRNTNYSINTVPVNGPVNGPVHGPGPSRNDGDIYIGMTLMDPTNQSYSIPAWKKSDTFLRDHPQVKIEKGFDGTGNLLVAENFKYLYDTYGGSMDLVTGDGGFDFSTDFDHQEVNVLPLLYAQIACAVCIQACGGSFVLKIFDLFTTPTIDLLALLSSLYDHVSLIKPVTSRYANSEKYVVCTGFRLDKSELPALFDVLYRNFYTACYSPYTPTVASLFSTTNVFGFHPGSQSSIPNPTNQRLSDFTSYPMYMHRLLTLHTVPCGFIHAVAEYNTILVQQQIENIHFTMNLIRENERNILFPVPKSTIDDSMKDNFTHPSFSTTITESVPPISMSGQEEHVSYSNKYEAYNSLSRSQTSSPQKSHHSLCDFKVGTQGLLSPPLSVRIPLWSNGTIRSRFMTRKIQTLLRNHMQKCVQWCLKHRLPYHNI